MLGKERETMAMESGSKFRYIVRNNGSIVKRGVRGISAFLLAVAALYGSASAQAAREAVPQSHPAEVTIYNSEIGALRTIDGGKTWQLMTAESAERHGAGLARKLSARHQGADAGSTGTTSVYPNPAANSVSIRYELNAPGEVNVAFHDLHGREVLRAFEGPRAAGEHSLSLDTRSLTEGVYQYRIVSNGSIIAGSTMVIAR